MKRGRICESATHWADIVTHKSEQDVRAGDKSAPAKDKEQRNITCLRKTQTRLFA